MDKDNNLPIATALYSNNSENTTCYIVEPSAPPYIAMTSENLNQNYNNNNDNVVYTDNIVIHEEEEYCGPISCCICIMMSVLFWPLALCVPLCPCDKRKKTINIVNRQ